VALIAGITAVCVWLTVARLGVSSDLTTLFPRDDASIAMARFTRAFGGGDLALVLVRGDEAADVEAAAREAADGLSKKGSIGRALFRVEPPLAILDPTLAWLYASPSARVKLAGALTPSGMRERLLGTKALLLAPGSSEASDWLARDPLRLAAIPWEGRREIAAGVAPQADGAFVADEGRARLVVLQPRGRALESAGAGAFVRDVESAIAPVRAAHARVRLELTGGHAIAQATEEMLRRDLVLSSSLSTALASLAFLLIFRRFRALAAVLPPLAAGTVWTMGLAAVVTPRLSALAIAFTAVVVGVGVDTGVHVYAALLDGRRRGLSPQEAAAQARAHAGRPTLLAAAAAAAAFASLAVSELEGMRQLGLLCAAGEILTAVAILAITPEIGAWLERSEAPPETPPRWVAPFASLGAPRSRAILALVFALLPVAALLVLGGPAAGDAVVALRPRDLSPLHVQEEIYTMFGGRPGQSIVLVEDADEERARARADRIAEALDPLVEGGAIDGYDALASFAPAATTERSRLVDRDALDLPAHKTSLAAALAEAGFSLEACAPALDAFAHPTSVPVTLARSNADDEHAWLRARYLAKDGDRALAAVYVRTRPGGEERALGAVLAADPAAQVTGYSRLDRALRATLTRDLPKVGVVALLLVALALRAAVGSFARVALVLAMLAAEIGLLFAAMRTMGLGWHVYDALVLPVLVGITIDEAVFLLRAAEGEGTKRALATQGTLVATTALTTAAGFAALVVCRFPGLRDLGAVGALGSTAGLFAALVVVPAGIGAVGGRGEIAPRG
jgi:predicted RND superfamily exporter protein